MKNIEELAVRTYSNNIDYLEKKQKKLFSKIAALDSAIDQGLYSSKYELIHEDDYFEVKELSTNKHLYNSNSNSYAKRVSKSINSDRKTNLFKTFKDIDIKKKDLQKYNEIDIRDNSLVGLASILHYIKSNASEDADMKSLEKFIFLGIGLGGHIFEVHKKIKSKLYLIIEDDLELFKLSLFVTPYSEIAKEADLIFSIFETKEEFTSSSQIFLNINFHHNHYLKFFQMLSHSEEKLQHLHINIISQSHHLFYYNTILDQYLRPLDYLAKNYKFLNILKKHTTLTLGSKPVLFLAAGLSLVKNISWIRENQDRFIIVALSATLIELEKNNISPDIVTHMDGFDISFEHFKKLQSLKFLKDTLFLISARTPKLIVDFLEKENIFFFENGTNYKKSFGNLSAPCIGSVTYLLLLAFEVRELYLLGLDLAIDSKSGFTHAQSHFTAIKVNLESANIHEDNMSFRHSVITRASNHGDIAYTNPNFLLSIESVNSASQNFKKSFQNVYNLSDGVYFTNTIPLHISKLDISLLEKLDKYKIKKNILKDFELNSNRELLEDEKNDIVGRFNHTLRVRKIIKKQKDDIFASEAQFLNSLEVLYKNLTKNSSIESHDLSLVYQEYFHLLNTYIFDFFNVEDLGNANLHAMKINSLLCEQLLKILVVYESGLREFI